jgi:hypothetical protein
MDESRQGRRGKGGVGQEAESGRSYTKRRRLLYTRVRTCANRRVHQGRPQSPFSALVRSGAAPSRRRTMSILARPSCSVPKGRLMMLVDSTESSSRLETLRPGLKCADRPTRGAKRLGGARAEHGRTRGTRGGGPTRRCETKEHVGRRRVRSGAFVVHKRRSSHRLVCIECASRGCVCLQG